MLETRLRNTSTISSGSGGGGSGGLSSLSIGQLVSGGGPNQILFIASTGGLGASPNLVFTYNSFGDYHLTVGTSGFGTRGLDFYYSSTLTTGYISAPDTLDISANKLEIQDTGGSEIGFDVDTGDITFTPINHLVFPTLTSSKLLALDSNNVLISANSGSDFFTPSSVFVVRTNGSILSYGNSLLNAQSGASFGETIFVQAGSYSLGTGWLSKNGVDWWFDANSTVTSTGANGVWFDSNTAMTFKVTGYGNFVSTSASNVATIYMKSNSSNTYWQFNTVYAKGGANSPALRMNGNHTLLIAEYSKSDNYDAFWGESGVGYLEANELSATINTGDNAIELDSGVWYIKTKVARGSGKSGSPSIMLLDGAVAWIETEVIGRGGIVSEECVRTDNFFAPVNAYIKNQKSYGFINYGNAGGVSGDFLKVEGATVYATAVTGFEACLVQASGLTLKNVNLLASTNRTTSISGSGQTFTAEGNVVVNMPLGAGLIVGGGGMIYQSSSSILYGYSNNKNYNYDGSNFLLTGNLKLATSGNGFYVKEGANATMGTGILASGTAVVSTNKVTANTRIFISDQGGSVTNVGSLYVSARSAGASFTISSVNVLDASTFAWLLVEPA